MPAVELGNFMKPSRVVLILDGGYSRHKADSVKKMLVMAFQSTPIAMLSWQKWTVPLKVIAAMGKKKITKMSKLFLKVYSFTHLLLTRYSVGIPLDKTVVNWKERKDIIVLS